MATQLPNQAMFSPAEIAELFGVSRRTVLRWIANGRIGSFRISYTVRVTHEDLEAFLQRHRSAPRQLAANHAQAMHNPMKEARESR